MRYFFNEKLTEEDTQITLQGEEVKHVTRVNRLGEGDVFGLINGRGYCAEVSILSVRKNEIDLEVIKGEFQDKSEKSEITVIQGLSGKGVFSEMVSKAVELGVDRLLPTITEYSVVKVKDPGIFQKKYEVVAREALKQCKRFYEMVVLPPVNLEEAIQTVAVVQKKYLLDPYEGVTFRDIEEGNREEEVVLAIGPEGGFSEKELEQFLANGFQKLKLPGHILKADTALVASLSLFRYGRRE